MLRNPHGRQSFTREWTGEWGDQDYENWTDVAKKTLKYANGNPELFDGLFWMNSSDFLANFKYLYVCRELTVRMGWRSQSIMSEWKGNSSAGFPGQLRNVPQYKLTLSQPSAAYVALTQTDDSGSSFKGKLFIGWMVSREQGKLMTKIDKTRMISKAGISDLKVLSQEVEFDAKVSYPYSFTIVCGSKDAGPAGEGGFEIKVYSRDPKMTL